MFLRISPPKRLCITVTVISRSCVGTTWTTGRPPCAKRSAKRGAMTVVLPAPCEGQPMTMPFLGLPRACSTTYKRTVGSAARTHHDHLVDARLLPLIHGGEHLGHKVTLPLGQDDAVAVLKDQVPRVKHEALGPLAEVVVTRSQEADKTLALALEKAHSFTARRFLLTNSHQGRPFNPGQRATRVATD